MVVLAQSGFTTSLAWWAHLRVEGNSVMLANSSEEGLPDPCLVVAELSSDAEAKARFRTLNERILLKARTFDARDWAGLARDHTTEGSAEGGR